SAQLKSGSRLSNWVTTPMRFFASRTCAGIGRPKASMLPASGPTCPRHMRIVVVLPAPLGPITPRHSPGWISSDRSLTTVFAPYFLTRWAMRKIGAGMERECASDARLAAPMLPLAAASIGLFSLVGRFFSGHRLGAIDQLDERHRRV